MKAKAVLTRIFLSASELDKTIDFYENLIGQKCTMRFKYSEKELELASVSSFLLVAGSADHLQPFKDTRVTFMVDSIDEFTEFFAKHGSIILNYPKTVPTGKNMLVKHPDGLVVEYVEHRTDTKA